MNPRLCLLDHESLGESVELIRTIARVSGDRTIVLTLDARASRSDPRAALEAGARGVVSKDSGADVLLGSIERVLLGGEVVVTGPRRRPRVPVEAVGAPVMPDSLTTRERQILALLVAGAGTQWIAQELRVSPMTVRTHVRSVLMKLGANSRLKAASVAVRYGLLENEALAAARSSVLAAS